MTTAISSSAAAVVGLLGVGLVGRKVLENLLELEITWPAIREHKSDHHYTLKLIRLLCMANSRKMIYLDDLEFQTENLEDSKRLKLGKMRSILHSISMPNDSCDDHYSWARHALIGHIIDQLNILSESKCADQFENHELKLRTSGFCLKVHYRVFMCSDIVSTMLTELKCCGKSHPVVIDCTASQQVANKYAQILANDVCLVCANKKGVAGPSKLWADSQLTEALGSLFRVAYPEGNAKTLNKYRMMLYESSVGAGLPILRTLKDLVMSGERIVLVEGVLSGTLSFLFNSFCEVGEENLEFSKVLSKAIELGFCEPDPREDLSGMDVARKLLICARVSTMLADAKQNSKIWELVDVVVHNLVPEQLRQEKGKTITEFLNDISQYDLEFDEMRNNAAKKGKVLRYVGRFDGKSMKCGLQEYPSSHPFYSLKSSTNTVLIQTSRSFSEQCPLVIQGPGAGPDVTAFGVISDLVRCAEVLSQSNINE